MLVTATGVGSRARRAADGASNRLERRRCLVAAVERVEPRQLLSGYVPLAPQPSPWATGYFAPAGTVDLQANAAMAPALASDDASSLPRDVPVNANGLPLLNSRANGEGVELFIDFPRDDGYYRPFSLDDDRSNFNAAEQLAIYNCWREVVGFFSQFNVNVTTVIPPTGGANPAFAWLYVTNEFPGGEANVGWLDNNAPHGRVNSGNATGRVSGMIHEFGHLLGLNHQADYDKYGAKLNEYTDGTDYRNRPIMGVDYAGTIRTLYYGHPSTSNTYFQDDVAIVAGKVASVVGSDGYRPDDFGNTLATAYTLAAGSQQLDGFTERYADADVFKITPTSAGPWTFSATPLYLSQAEPKLEILNASGAVIASADDADLRNGPTNEQNLTVNLAPGTYYVRVTSGGDYDELGYYKFAATQLPAGFASADVGVPLVSGSVTYDSATAQFTQSGGGGDIWNTSDQFRYTYATLTGDGSITARVDSLDNLGTYTKAGVMIRQSLAGNAAHAFLGIKPDGGIDSIYRGTAGASAANVNNNGSGPWVRITRVGNSFTYARSADGTNWTTLGTTTIAMNGPVLIGLATCAWADSRYEAFSTFSNVALTGNIMPAAPTYNGLGAPATVSAVPAPGANTSVNVTWAASAGATGYVIERSANGVDFTKLGTVAAGVLSYTDVSPWGSLRWYYRVSAANGTSVNSTPSAVVSVVNKPNAPIGTIGGYTPTVMALGTDTIALEWMDVQGETGYRVERSTDGVNFTTLGTTGSNQAGYVVYGLPAGTAYTFRITPLTTVGDDLAPSLLINAQTRMAAVSNLRFTARSSTSLTIAWNDSTLETGYRIERSSDGVNWTFLGDTAAGVTTYTSNGLTPGAEYYFRVMPWNTDFDGIMSGPVFTATPAESVPGGWNDADIGAVAGGGTGVSGDGSTWSIISGGGDVVGSADAFHFTYRTLASDGSIVARVTGVEATDNAAKAGLMIRQDGSAGSKFVAIMMNAGGGYGIDVRSRTTANAGYTYQQALANVTAPYWLRLTRSGNAVVAAYSADGATWTNAATINISLSGSVMAGMAVTSFSSTQLNSSTFSDVSVNTPTNSAPTVATAAAVTATTSTTATLSVLGDDAEEGEGGLSYTWAPGGGAPGPVIFTPNATNGAKNTVATFSKPGTYTLIAIIRDGGGLATTSSVTVTIDAVPTAVVASSPTLAAGTAASVKVVDQFGNVLQPAGLTWSANTGSITQSGVFTSPASGVNSATITATAGSFSQGVTLAVVAPRAWYKADATGGATLADSSGNNSNGTLTGAYGFVVGKTGNALGLTGGNATLPSGIVSSFNDFTFAAWVYPTSNAQWSRIFDFGTGANVNMFLTMNSGASAPTRFAITTSGGGGEQRIDAPALPLNTWSHIAVTISGNTGTIYINGAPAGTNTSMTLKPSSLGNTTQNYIGKSQYPDPAFAGRVDDLRLYNVGLSAAGVAALAQAWQVPTVATPASASPTTVNGTTTNLNVLGASGAGEAGLTYTWSVLGHPPGGVTFDANGTNAAKATTARFTASGSYTLLVTIADANGASVTSSVAVQVTVPVTLANVASAADVYEVGQHALRFTFDRDVGAQPWAELLSIHSLDGTRTVSPNAFSYDAASRTLTVTLPAGAAIADGNYVATLAKGTMLAADYPLSFFVLAGDADRDRAVGFSDLLTLAKNYNGTGRTLMQGDFDGDGNVTFSDLLILAKNYNHTLAAPAPATFAASASSSPTRTRRTAADIVN